MRGLIVALWLTCATSAYAQAPDGPITAGEMADICRAAPGIDPQSHAQCVMFVSGVMLGYTAAYEPMTGRMFYCPRKGWKLQHLIDHFVVAVDETPARRGLNAEIVILNVARTNYPCT